MRPESLGSTLATAGTPAAVRPVIPPATTDLLDAVDQPIIGVDLTRTITYWNRGAEEAFGWTAAEALGRNSVDVIVRNETPAQARAILETLLRGDAWSGDYDVLHRDGTARSTYVTNKPVFDERGHLVAVIAVAADTTERRAGARARRQRDAFVEGSDDAIISATVDFIVRDWNGAAERIFGYTAGEAIGQHVSFVVPPDLAGPSPERIQATGRRKDGTLIDLLVTSSMAHDEAGAVTGLSLTVRDNSETMRAWRALEASERQLAEAQRAAHIGSFELDVASRTLTWSAEYYRILGVDPRVPATDALFLEHVHVDDVQSVRRAWTDAVRRGNTFDIVFRLLAPGGSLRWVRARSVPQTDDEGVVTKVSGTLSDDTKTIEADRLRVLAETRFETGFEQSAIGSAIVDLEGIPLRVNPALCTILGRKAEQLIGQRWTDYTHPDDESLGALAGPFFAAGHDAYHDERRYLRPDGSTVWASVDVARVCDDSGAPQYLYLQVQDITARKHAESALQSSEERLRVALAHAPVGMAVRDLDGRWLEVNQALCDLIGRSERELETMTMDDVVHADDLQMEREFIARLVAGDGPVFTFDKRYVHADGHTVDVLASIAIGRDELGTPNRVIVQAQDITDRKRVETERDGYLHDLRRSNAELEQFAYIASHDLAEPLRAISGPVSLLGRRYRGVLDDEADEFIDFAVDGCKRMQTLIDDLLAYSRVGRTEVDAGPVDCDLLMAAVLKNLQIQIEATGARVDVGPLPTVWGHAIQIGQVLQNLVSNAIKFTAADEQPVVTVAACRSDSEWRFTIDDCGIGIEPRHRDRIFGMFKRLHGRETYGGTGIGLAVVKKIVESSGGRFGVDDGPDGRGSSFWFTIPTTREVASP